MEVKKLWYTECSENVINLTIKNNKEHKRLERMRRSMKVLFFKFFIYRSQQILSKANKSINIRFYYIIHIYNNLLP